MVDRNIHTHRNTHTHTQKHTHTHTHTHTEAVNNHVNLTSKIKDLLKNSMIFSIELLVLTTTGLKMVLEKLPDLWLKELRIIMVEIKTLI